MKRRIIFSNYDDPKNPFYGGGGARAIHEVARRLAVRHDVKIITGSYPGSRDEMVDGVSYARIGSDNTRVRRGNASTRILYHDDVVVGARGNLWKVRDGKHLMVLGHAPHGVTNL